MFGLVTERNTKAMAMVGYQLHEKITYWEFFIPGIQKEFSQLEMIQTYFDSSTFDLIERNTKNTFETQISLIGGTMGLFTGFSILSAVEILYFIIKYLLSFRLKFKRRQRKI